MRELESGLTLKVDFSLSTMKRILSIHSNPDIVQWSVAAFFAAIVAFSSFRFRLLDGGGAIGAFILGTIVFGIGGLRWAVPVLAFFLSSSLLSRIGIQKKSRAARLYEKSARRDFAQVLANGGVAGIAILLFQLTHSEWSYILFLGSLSAVTGDTWSTEIGPLSRIAPRSIVNFRKVTVGTSGAITPLGTVAALLAGLFLSILGYFLHEPQVRYNWEVFLIISISGLFGSLLDSILGATMQAQYRCPGCGNLTESRSHCGGLSTSQVRGYSRINNDAVNMIAAMAGGLFAAACYVLSIKPG